MKLLMFYAPSFWFKTFQRVLPEAPEVNEEREVQRAAVVFYQAEAGDQERRAKVLAKLVKNVKWLAGKFGATNVVLHSFNHLSASKAPPELAAGLAAEAAQRLQNAGYAVTATPFGYLNEWKMHVAGESLAKVFKEI
ncbi:MAG: threonyl-tRNA synthetase editing domain-containing protein [Thermodesulfobacteriota bacterium]